MSQFWDTHSLSQEISLKRFHKQEEEGRKRAASALGNTISSVFRIEQELTSLSQNHSLTLDNDTRQILMSLGRLTDLST
jgi:hypothetical protein